MGGLLVLSSRCFGGSSLGFRACSFQARSTQTIKHVQYRLYSSMFRLVHGKGIPMGIPGEMSHWMGWDGTAGIAFPMGPMR